MTSPSHDTQPRFSIVSAVYNVARYLPDFIASIEAQTYDLSRVEVIMVDDGSTDESPDILKSWQESSPWLVKVITKENGGQGSARNLGISHATGEWITFTDPDDFFARDALAEMAAFMDAQDGQVKFYVSNLIVYLEAEDRLLNNHPLRSRFSGGNQVVDLNRFPNYFHMSAATAFFLRKALVGSGLHFDDRVKPAFEDAHFIAHYLLLCNPPLVGFVASASYMYRRRSDLSSTLQTASFRAERYTDVNRYGLLDVLVAGKRLHGTVPIWLQNMIIYDLSWIFGAEEGLSKNMRAIDHGVEDEFHELMEQITALLHPRVIAHFDLLRLPAARVAALAHGYRGVPWHEEGALMDRFDPDQRLVRLSYLYVGTAPVETLRFRGRPVEPIHAKHRDLTYSGRVLVRERILWARTDGTLMLQLNGEPVPLWRRRPRHKATWRPAEIQNAFASRRKGPPKLAARSALFESARQIRVAAWRIRAGQQPERKEMRLVQKLRDDPRYQDAWLLMDRDVNAHDNAEHLFRYLRTHRPKVNAWFAVKEESEAFRTLKKAGFDNVVAHGSPEWIALCLEARHLISSHIDEYVVRPDAVLSHGTPGWRYSFLQHGVIHNDLSGWLNGKNIDLMITSSLAEYESIAGNGSPYRLTSREVKLTGLPRHDRLIELGRKLAPSERRDIVVMPTWRNFLIGPAKAGSGEREMLPDFSNTQFAHQWTALLRSARLHELAASADLEIVFMPHPNLEPYLEGFDLPDRVRVKSYGDSDVQEVLSNARVVLTDYSSIVFDAAVIERPVVYFQFDRSRVFSGGHTSRPGYFSFQRDGFGPVADNIADALTAIEGVLDFGAVPQDVYLDRIHQTFPVRDGESCARVTDAIIGLSKPNRRQVVAPEAPPILHWG